MSIKGRNYHRINGRARNEPIRLTEDELAAMAASLRSRRVGGKAYKSRRARMASETQIKDTD